MPSNPPDEIWLWYDNSNLPHVARNPVRAANETVDAPRYLRATPARENAEKLVEAATKLLASHRSSDVEDGLERVDADLVDALEAAINLCEEQ